LHFFEEKYENNFKYPYEGNTRGLCYQIRRGQQPDVPPINNLTFGYRNNNPNKCKDENRNITPHLLIIVKSLNSNFERRNAIRNSWGYEKRFSDVIIRTIFTLGIDKDTHDRERPTDIQKLIDLESEKNQDIIQFSFIDEYFNNTIKTVNGMRWAKENCIRSKFFLFVDDDYYVSVKNILAFLRNPVNYPEYLEEHKEQLRKLNQRKLQSTTANRTASRQILSLNIELPPDVKLFAGFVFNSSPHRHKSSK
jgi:beta-1,3-galactosyltransferase / beta-1,3-N-acetylglucosaminyltransferase